MQSNKWGPLGWDFSHAITFNYPLNPSSDEKLNYKKYFESFGMVLPCKICSNSFNFLYKNLPVNKYLEDRNGITYWFFMMHNLVNLKLGNKVIGFKEVILKYENMRARCGNINTKDKSKVDECQKELKWNNEMEQFYNNTINKYRDITIKKIVKIIQKNKDKTDIQSILKNIEILKKDLGSIF